MIVNEATGRAVEKTDQSLLASTGAANGGRQGQPPPRRKVLFALAGVVLCLAAVVLLGIRSRIEAESRLKVATHQAATPVLHSINTNQGAPPADTVPPGSTPSS